MSIAIVLQFAFCAVYNKRGYIDLVSHAAEASMRAAIEEVESLPGYEEEGEVTLIICMHQCYKFLLLCTINSALLQMQGMTLLPRPITLQPLWEIYNIHTNIHILYCSFYRTQKIVGISTISWTEHLVPQTREVACTKEVLPQVIARGYSICIYMYCCKCTTHV